MKITTPVCKEELVYETAQLEYFSPSEGRVVKTPGAGQEFRYLESYVADEYFYRDHLGNTRMRFSDLDGDGVAEKGEILQEWSYYPYGLVFEGLGTPAVGAPHRDGFNGKELESEFGLGWNDFGARRYDAALGRWCGVDALAEKYVEWSPYGFVMGDPVSLFDPNGMDPRWGQLGSLAQILDEVRGLINANPSLTLRQQLQELGGHFDRNVHFERGSDGALVINSAQEDFVLRYVYSKRFGWIDMRHFYGVASQLERNGALGRFFARNVESSQRGLGRYAYEDVPSNMAGIEFWDLFGDAIGNGEISLLDATERYLSFYALVVSPEEAPNYDLIPHFITEETNMKNHEERFAGINLQAAAISHWEKMSMETKEKIIDAHRWYTHDGRRIEPLMEER